MAARSVDPVGGVDVDAELDFAQAGHVGQGARIHVRVDADRHRGDGVPRVRATSSMRANRPDSSASAADADLQGSATQSSPPTPEKMTSAGSPPAASTRSSSSTLETMFAETRPQPRQDVEHAIGVAPRCQIRWG